MGLLVHDHGSVAILVPVTTAASDWMASHLHPDHQTWAGGVAVEPRSLPPILQRAVADGLELSA